MGSQSSYRFASVLLTHKIVKMAQHLIYAILVIYSTLVIGGFQAYQQDPTLVEIPQGLLQGKELRSREGKTFYGFMGVPFAQKPERFEVVLKIN